ncbi:MAG: type II toxin-antitoxin system ParD family antitoxin [Candidatus Colwellbacteria bacterium]|nr:type II toxin-antitoxin system ParD family antitoxin [Candidatus Colwellbacteria bacterium]
MSTLSVPLPPHLDEFVSGQVKKGLASNKADVVRKALKLLQEEEAVMAVLKAEQEPNLKGSLEKLAKKIK